MLHQQLALHRSTHSDGGLAAVGLALHTVKEGWQLWGSLWEDWQLLAYCTHSNGGLAAVWLALHTGMQLAICACDYERHV